MKILKESPDINIKKIDKYDAPNYREETVSAWRVTNVENNNSVFIEKREYFDNWNDNLDVEYAIYYDPEVAKENDFDIEEFYEEKFKNAKEKAFGMMWWI